MSQECHYCLDPGKYDLKPSRMVLFVSRVINPVYMVDLRNGRLNMDELPEDFWIDQKFSQVIHENIYPTTGNIGIRCKTDPLYDNPIQKNLEIIEY